MPVWKGFLVASMDSGGVIQKVTAVKRTPALYPSDACWPLEIRVPDPMSRLFSTSPIVLSMPGYTEPEVRVGEPETVAMVDAPETMRQIGDDLDEQGEQQ